MWGFRVGRRQKPRHFSLSGFLDILFSRAGLDQTEFNRPSDSPPAAIDIEFAVNTLGVSPHSAQGDDKLLSDLGTRQFGFEQAQDVQFTLAERLDQGR